MIQERRSVKILKLTDFLYEKRKRIKRNIRLYFVNKSLRKFIIHPFGNKVYIFDTPDHSNCGDAAIALAQAVFLRKSGYNEKRIKMILASEYAKLREMDFLVGRKQLICGIGGGNMGNQWIWHENDRRRIIEDFQDNPIIIFPQTIHFIDSPNKEEEMQKSKDIYNKHPRLLLSARDRVSFEIMTDLFKNNYVLSVPDIVLFTKKEDYGIVEEKRSGVLLVFRHDEEKNVSDSEKFKVSSWLSQINIEYHETDMVIESRINNDNRFEIVKSKMQEYARSRLVITDRLHGMIFAALTETPCIVFGNYNHKVKGTYDWISYLDYIQYVENADEAIELIPAMLGKEDCKFDNSPLMPYYNQLMDVIRKYV